MLSDFKIMTRRTIAVATVLFASMVLGVPLTAVAQTAAVGSVEFSKGVVSAQVEGDTARLLGRGAEILVKDRIETASQSFAIILFEDGSRITLRPNTVFHVAELNANKGSENALFKLAKGGFRVLTGFISKASNGVFKVETPVATIGVRGTEFDARLCADEESCNAATASAEIPAAILVSVNGDVTFSGPTGDRTATRGASAFSGDKVVTGDNSWGVLIFSDGTRVTVQPRSEFVIESYEYSASSPAGSNFLVRVLVGSLRALTGAIAKISPDNFKVATDDGTIGVRGTGFDIADNGATLISVWDSCIDAASSVASLAVCQGQNAVINSGADAPALLDSVPGIFNNQPGPRPDQVDSADADQAFAAFSGDNRLFVAVTDGIVELDNGQSQIEVAQSQFAVVTEEGLQILSEPPSFMLEDALPRPSEINGRVLEMFDLIQDGMGTTGSGAASGAPLECAVQ